MLWLVLGIYWSIGAAIVTARCRAEFTRWHDWLFVIPVSFFWPAFRMKWRF